ncbi:MAG TPA: hypothetical protein VMU87_13850 [Stellaceae bacterium]|nr:hypothetical protein [Stellaceae bacterium]
MARSPYCARHRALCRIAPGTEAAARIARAQARAADRAAPPPPYLAACAVPDPVEAAEPDDALAALHCRPGTEDEAW